MKRNKYGIRRVLSICDRVLRFTESGVSEVPEAALLPDTSFS